MPKFEQRGGFIRGARARVRLIEGGSERLVGNGGKRFEPRVRGGPNPAENCLGPGQAAFDDPVRESSQYHQPG